MKNKLCKYLAQAGRLNFNLFNKALLISSCVRSNMKWKVSHQSSTSFSFPNWVKCWFWFTSWPFSVMIPILTITSREVIFNQLKFCKSFHHFWAQLCYLIHNEFGFGSLTHTWDIFHLIFKPQKDHCIKFEASHSPFISNEKSLKVF